MSDWGATHSVSIADGLDQEQDGNDCVDCEFPLHFTEDAIKKVEGPVLDQAVYRILWATIETGVFDAAIV